VMKNTDMVAPCAANMFTGIIRMVVATPLELVLASARVYVYGRMVDIAGEGF